jgi:putative toxin-antitoxin system antitoxin component (TIGR02293 family)
VFGQFELPKSAIYDLIPRSSYHKKGTPRLSQAHSERLFAVSKVFAEALRLYGDDRIKASEFLRRPHALFDGRSPMDLALESTAGAEIVLRNLARAEAGVAV